MSDNTPTPEDLGLAKQETTTTETTQETGAPEGTPPKRRRGRPPGSASKTASTEAPKKSASRKAEDVQGLARQLVGIHQLMAMTTGLAELAISQDEGNMLAASITAVTEEYGFALSGKTGAAIQLFGAAAIIYGPRMLVIKAKIDAKKAAEKAEAERTLNGDGGMIYAANAATH